MRIALDTNVLAYAEGTNGAALQDSARHLLETLPPESIVVPVQALGELFNVLVRKARWPATTARSAVLSWRDAYAVAETSASVMMAAADLATDHQLRIWDAVMVSVAAEAGCRLFLSEDLQHGYTWRGVTVTNPFGDKLHPLLAALLEKPE